MNNLILVKRAGLRINEIKPGSEVVNALEVEGLLAKKQAELMALTSKLGEVEALLKRMTSHLEGV